jgi:S-formylglutathione hydrolase FrmB
MPPAATPEVPVFRFASRLAVGLLVGGVVVGCSAAGATPSPAGKTAAPSASASSAPDASCKSTGEPTNGYEDLSCTIAAPSLANNVLGDPAAIKADILLPADYATSGTRYPVAYVLAGFQSASDQMVAAINTQLTATGTPRGVILVFASGMNGLQGSFYMNSPVTGNWDDAIAKDLVGYVDSHYRTIAKSESRGLAGHSMGGHGALAVGMRHPDLFSVIYSISPGLFDASGFEARLGLTADPAQIEAETAISKRLEALPASQRGAALVVEASTASTDTQFLLAYGAAFAPDTQNPALMKWPYKLESGKVVRDDAVYKLWESGFGGLPDRITAYGAGLKALRGFVIEYGTYDQYPWIPAGSHYFVTLLQAAGIPVTENVFEGDHLFSLGDRLANHMLPLMVDRLAKN